VKLREKVGVAVVKAIENKDKAGLIVFSDEITDYLEPSGDFKLMLDKIIRSRALGQTNIPVAINKAIEVFSDRNTKKHLLIISDIEPTVGEFPMDETLKAIQSATAAGISISIVGIEMPPEGEKLARKIIDITRGKLYLINNTDEVDRIVLEDYYSI